MARTMLLDALHLPNHKKLWAEAVKTANYIRNRLYSSASNDTSKTPYEIIMGKKPDLSHVRKFGAKSYVHIPKQKRKGKFDKRAEVGFCVGFTAGNGYKVYLPHAKKVLVSRDVTFEETTSSQTSKTGHRSTGTQGFSDPFESLAEHQYESDLPVDLGESPETDDTHTEEQQPTICQTHENVGDTAESTEANLDTEAVTHYPDLRRSSREKRTPERFIPGMLALMPRLGNDDSCAPLTYSEAMERPDSEQWKLAMDEEIIILNKETWTLVPRPQGVKPVKCKWVYVNKRDAHGRITRRRARLVAKGFTQQEGIDFNEIFSPVAKYSTVRFMLALAKDLEMLQIDVKSAFLNGNLMRAFLWSNQRDM